MSLLHGLLGNASEKEVGSVEKDLAMIISDGESVQKAYKLIRDLIILTNKRLIYVDVQGITGKKREYHSIPYTKITQFSVETAGHLDLDAELKIWVAGMSAPREIQFSRSANLTDLVKVLSYHVLNA
ncbi:MAG: PH domain-containing protein [Methanomicrobiales archaeon]|nr:PH domain-containing protein [Methanomicrobiales archaeon]